MGISQAPEGRQLFAAMSVMDNLLLGSYHRYGRKTKNQIHQDIDGIFELFPILKERIKQKAGTLSGGEQQMLAIGRALTSRPKILLLDEPSMGLAPLVIKEIFSRIRTLRDEGTTILLVEQNAKAALNVADRGYVMETGKIVFQETTEQLKENREVQRAYLGKGYKEVWE
jgi:branched-chain amino acid transport system ATP-binding protein